MSVTADGIQTELTGLFGRPKSFFHYVFYAVLYLACPIAVLFAFYLLDQPYQLDDNYRIAEADFVMSLSDTPPLDGWQQWDSNNPPIRIKSDPFMSIWYRFDNPMCESTSALYVPFPKSNLDIWYQGERLKQLGKMDLPLYYSRSPMLVPIGPSDSAAANNKVYIRIARYGSETWLPYTYVAPYELAERDFRGQKLVSSHSSIVVLCAMSVVFIFMFAVFLVDKQETAYGLYSLTLLLWGLHTAHGLINAIPFHHPFWFALGYLTLWWVMVELIFVNRFFAIPNSRMEKIVIVTSAILSMILVVVSMGRDSAPTARVAMFLFEPWVLVCSFIVAFRYFRAIRDAWTFESVSLWLTSGVFVAVAIRDLLYEITPANIPGNMFYLQFIALLPLLLFGAHLVRRYARALKVSRQRSQQLDKEVAERTAELERSYRKLAMAESERSVAEERERLMRDVHDGLGGQLVNALALSEQSGDEDLQESLRQALNDLRLIVDSLSAKERGLNELIAMFRHRISRSLQRAGFIIDWKIEEVGERVILRARDALSVLRILQESVTNAMRHSGSKYLRIELLNANDVLLRVSDSGIGLNGEVEGLGLRNMQARAAEMGGRLDIQSSENGTTISFSLPTQ